MAKCFITGVDLSIHEAYILDRAAAHRALKDIQEQLSTLQRLIEQLGAIDDSEIFDVKNHKMTLRRDRRLVTSSVAEVLSAAYPKAKLFTPWREWRQRRSQTNNRALLQTNAYDQVQNDAAGGENDNSRS